MDEITIKSGTESFTISPTGAAFGRVTAIRVQDIVRDVWYNWGNQVADGWDTSDWTGTEGQKNLKGTPVCTSGANNLYIAFWVENQGATGYLTLAITDAKSVLATKTVSVPTGEGLGVEWTGDMPSGNYTVTVSSTLGDSVKFTIKPVGGGLPFGLAWWQIGLIALAAVGVGGAAYYATRKKHVKGD